MCALKVPVHAFPTGVAELQSWQCERGYARNGNVCAEVHVPEHAYLNDTGDGWTCERGFSPEGQSCSQLSLPRNAHLDARGNEWFCNLGFEKQGSQCAPTDSAALASAH